MIMDLALLMWLLVVTLRLIKVEKELKDKKEK